MRRHWSLVIGHWPALLLLVLTACDPIKPPTPPVPPPTPAPTPTPKPPPTPTPIPVVDRKRMDVSELFSDIQVVSKVETVRSDETASLDRTQPGSLRLELTLHADVPVASKTLAQVTRNDDKLPAALPGLEPLLASARVSPAFEQLYALKLDYLKARLGRIDTLLDRHNFYDCETILEMQNPATGRRALFLQGDMDVNTDGSDGDRNFDIVPGSIFFQPQTSYRWKRLTGRPNQFLEITRAKLAANRAEAAAGNANSARQTILREAIKRDTAVIYELENYSFLIAGNDPYIVLPGFMLRGAKGPFAPGFGDYAAVVHNGIVYPAILGDAGPSFKFGEAAIRLCQQLNPRSTANSRPVSSLKVTYIVFPGSKDAAPGPPDLAKWRTRCEELFTDLGVKPASIHTWQSLIKPWPTPTPTPTPTPSPTPTPVATPTPTPPAPAATATPVPTA
jgi:hypothetical protein